ncbi:MAG: hypothetical protein DMD91_01030 [Candidatus Rokuibacteriota bacterium]|nr:MAG: hypothetical protein DMD91_01030 [Candidatus Rokubacteria bacterium]
MCRWLGDGRGWAGKVLLAGWIVIALTGLASLSLSHMAAMPEPGDEAQLTRAMLTLRRGATTNFLVHVISAGCSCTDRLFAHLVERGRLPGSEELVLFVGEDPAKRQSAERAGFAFTTVSAAELADRYGLEAAPVLIAFDATGRLRYAGGYFAHPSTGSPLDEKIYAQLADAASPDPLPVFGCAVSARLQKSVDPLGIVYSSPVANLTKALTQR